LVNGEYKSALKSQLKPTDFQSKAPRVLQRLEDYLEKSGPLTGPFAHYRPARYFHENLDDLAKHVSKETKDRFEKAFKDLNSLLARGRSLIVLSGLFPSFRKISNPCGLRFGQSFGEQMLVGASKIQALRLVPSSIFPGQGAKFCLCFGWRSHLRPPSWLVQLNFTRHRLETMGHCAKI